jgi:hypothetical protein
MDPWNVIKVYVCRRSKHRWQLNIKMGQNPSALKDLNHMNNPRMAVMGCISITNYACLG